MNADQDRAKSIFLNAAEMASPVEQEAYLVAACGDNQALRAEVVGLLKHYAPAVAFLEACAPNLVATIAEPVLSERPGAMIGPYKLLEQIGEGGFGVVFMAEQTQPVHRKVALKVLKPGMDTRQVVARFEAEQQALAILDHPNIAKVFDGGATSSGRPYFVMELVKGVPITEFCDRNRLETRQRLELFVSVCQAVQHAHQKGIIHRDLKPSNVLVSRHDTTPIVKVIDFGIAKALGQALTDKTLCTSAAQMIGTPLYMSPEQAGMSDLDVDTRSDVYSLGVMLYELLTGTTPFTRERFKQNAYDEIRRIIREEEPPMPSTRLLQSKDSLPLISAQRQMEPAKLIKLARGELDWIVMKALEKDRNRRYETADGCAADVQRYLADEPVRACPASAGYRLRKFVRRNRRILAPAVALAVAVLVVAGTLGWVVRDREARQVRLADECELALQQAEMLQGQGKREEALRACERAELLAGETALDPAAGQRLAVLRERLDAEALDQEFVARFEEIRLLEQTRVNEKESRFAIETAFPEIRDSLCRYGIEIGVTETAQVANRIQGRPQAVQEQVLAALQECAALAPKQDWQTQKWLLAALQAADGNPWRAEVRKSWAARDWQALERLVREVDVQTQPSSFLLWVARRLLPRSRAARLALWRRTQQAYPADFWANEDLGRELTSQRRPAEAVRYYTAAVALRPHNPGVYLNRGIALLHAGELDAALADYRLAIAIAPRYSAAHNNLGIALLAKGDTDEAITAFRKAIASDRKYAEAHYNLGNALRTRGDLEGAITAFRAAIVADPKHSGAHNNLGNVLRTRGDLKGAITAFQKAIAADRRYALAHYNLGTALKVRGDLEEAIRAFKNAIALNKDHAAAHSNLGDVFRLQGKADEAIVECRQAIKLKPESHNAYLILGNALRDQGKLAEALEQYRQAIKLKPKDHWSYYCLGNVLTDLGRPDEAIIAYRQAIALNPKFEAANRELGNRLLTKGDVGKAIHCYRVALGRNPKSALVHCCLGNALLAKGDVEGAIGRQRTALEFDPKLAEAHASLGNALLVKGDVEGAIHCCRTAIALIPKRTDLHLAECWKAVFEGLQQSMARRQGGARCEWLCLALVHWTLGDKGQARQWYDRAASAMEKDPTRNEVLRRFQAEAAELLGVKDKKD